MLHDLLVSVYINCDLEEEIPSYISENSIRIVLQNKTFA